MLNAHFIFHSPFRSFLHSLLSYTHHFAAHSRINHRIFWPDSTREKKRRKKNVGPTYLIIHYTMSLHLDPCSTVSPLFKVSFACYYGNDVDIQKIIRHILKIIPLLTIWDTVRFSRPILYIETNKPIKKLLNFSHQITA